MEIKRRNTWDVKAGDLLIGSAHPIVVQSMCATKTQDIDATLGQVKLLESHGAKLIRIAVDSNKDVAALKTIAEQATAAISVDLQESYRLAKDIAPFVDKIRYNPGHLHHHQKEVSVADKVKFIIDQAGAHNCAIRIGINFGSLDPEQAEKNMDPIEVALASAEQHIEILDKLGFKNYLVSLKSSDPNAVQDINRSFADRFENVPLHLGVTEAGMLPDGEIKSRIALESLLASGIGDTLRVSLTLPFSEKYKEIEIGNRIVSDVYAGRFRSVPRFVQAGLNIISCPSCSRVENEAFVELAQKVKEMSQFAQSHNLTVAVMGCRVNGPGESDDADLGLWCAPKHVNLKKRGVLLGAFSYEEILDRVKLELGNLIQNL